MNLTFTPTRTAISLWWAMVWRGIIWMLVFLIPYLLAIFLFFFAFAMLMLALGVSKPTIHLIGNIISFGLENIFVPIAMYTLMFWRIFKAPRFGTRKASGTLHGQPVTTLGTAFRYAAWFYLEVLKYCWPMFLLCVLLGVGIATGTLVGGPLVFLGLAIMLLGIYIHWLILADLLHRRNFGPLTLVVENASAPATGHQQTVVAPSQKTTKSPAKEHRKV